LNLLTLGGYGWVWFYKTWMDYRNFARSLTDEEKDRIATTEEKRKLLKYLSRMNVDLHAIAILVEWLRLYFAALLFWQIAKLDPKPRRFPSHYALLFALADMVAVDAAFKLYQTDFLSAFLVGLAPQIVGQLYVNDFWKEYEPTDLPLRQRFTANEYLLIALGAGSIGILFSGLMPQVPLPSGLLEKFLPELFGTGK
jgi:hypothetical protein